MLTTCYRCGKTPTVWRLTDRFGTYDICYDCSNSITITRQQYGFWLRGFTSEHFIPCEKCQDELHEMLMTRKNTQTVQIFFYEQSSIMLTMLSDEWQFQLDFLSAPNIFKPCGECQKKLQDIWENKELHIGSEVKPPIELWRRMQTVEE